MKTLTVTLQQHTPLIHFQHGQYGATLRASEVKPKLDRFLLTQLGDSVSNKWLIGQDRTALNYKLRIYSEIKEKYLVASYLGRRQDDLLGMGIKSIAPSPYFAQEKFNNAILRGNQHWDDIPCKGVMLENICLTFHSIHDDLVNYVSSKLEMFFLIENFGTRQNKGFGCFVVTAINGTATNLTDKRITHLLTSHFKHCYYKTLPNNSFSTIYQTIVNDYRLLKSGNPIPYRKSKLMLYGKGLRENNHQLRWEKKFFKERLNRTYERGRGTFYELKCKPELRNDVYRPINPQTEKYVYLRALLGVANQYEFLLENPPANNKKMIVSVNSDEVGRFKSPLTFKVIGKSIYVVCNDIASEIFGKRFDFKMSVQEDRRNTDPNIIRHRNRNIGSLYTPQNGTFDIGQFLDRNIIELGYTKIK